MSEKTYLSDGVYAFDDGFHIILSADRENGENLIYLDGSVLRELFRFIEKSQDLQIKVSTAGGRS